MSGLFTRATASAVSSSTSSSSSNPETKKSKKPPRMPLNPPIKTTYTSLPVPIPPTFLAPLPSPSHIKVTRIDFANSPLPEYKSCYAVVLDNVLSREECAQLIRYAEQSAGGTHPAEEQTSSSSSSTAPPSIPDRDGDGEGDPDQGWRPALVNIGGGHEILIKNYRNSDRIIWDQGEVTQRIWARVLQGEGMREYFGTLGGEAYEVVIGRRAVERGERWVVTERGMNERMRFLKYGPGGYFRPHCDGAYTTPDGTQTSWYTIHLYLNDSAQALDSAVLDEREKKNENDEQLQSGPELLRGGATTFHGHGVDRQGRGGSRLDVDPLAGRVLLFHYRFLEHSGDEVTAGIKYTLRSDIMYEREGDGANDE